MKFARYASAGILLTLASFGSASPPQAAGHGLAAGPPAGPPKFYIESGIAPHGARKLQNVVRATATGAITGTVSCPWAKSTVQDIAAAASQTFFVDCIRFSAGPGSKIIETRIYRFQVTAAGRTARYRLVPGGTFEGQVGGLAASANGAVLAVGAAPPAADASEIIVINTKTGRHAIWRGGVMPGGEIFAGGRPSLTVDGKELAVFGRAHCPKGGAPGSCKSPGEEMRVVSPALAGGKLASGRMVFRESQLTNPKNGYINGAFIDSGGTTVTAPIVFGGLTGSYVEVLSVSVTTGKPLKVEFKLNTGDGFNYRFVSADPSGRWVLFDAGRSSTLMNGWVDNGKLVPLKPTGGFTFGEVWSS
jgi:hypothetical protein